MFELIAAVLFLGLLVGIVWQACRITRGMAKLVILIALALALPALVSFFLMVSGIFLLTPLGLTLVIFSLVKSCV
jgi:hypothetical protein